MNYIIGRHLSIKHIPENITNKFLALVNLAHLVHCQIFQLFLTPPTLLFGPKYDKYFKKFNILSVKFNIQNVIHSSYTLNFAYPTISRHFKLSIKSLIHDLNNSVKINSIGVVVHVGRRQKHVTKEDAKNNYVTGIKEVLKNSNPKSIILLETGASQGNELDSSVEELGILLRKINDKRVKICIDTCHVWTAGNDMTNIVELVEKEIGWKNIGLIHLNDSKNELGSKIDRHADIGFGQIPLERLKNITKHAMNLSVPIILETPCNSENVTMKNQISTIKKWNK